MAKRPSTTHGRSEIWERKTLVRMIDREQLRLGERLREQRTALGLTQEKAAERSGLHPGTLKRIEAGHVNITIASLLALAVAYGVDLRELFDDKDAAAKKRTSKAPD